MSTDELGRYSRHIMLPEFGRQGQERLRNGSVLLVGAGGLGSPVALYLAAAGVGRIGLIDGDTVDLSNLQRQVLFGTSNRGEAKVDAGAERLRDLNPSVAVETYPFRLDVTNAMELFSRYDVIVDGADNFSTRYLCNDAAVVTGTPLVHGSIFKFEGQATVFHLEDGPCYRCIYPEPPPAGTVPSCGEVGVLGILPGMIGMVQATEVLKILAGIGDPLSGRILMYDALAMEFRTLRVDRDPDCPVCGSSREITDLNDYNYGELCFSSRAVEPAAENGARHHTSTMEETMSMKSIEVQELAEWREARRPHTLIDVREENEYEFANIGGQLIPLSQLPDRMSEIPEDGDVVIMCRSGGRSGQACQILTAAGRTNVINLNGGILAWSDKVDQSIPKY